MSCLKTWEIKCYTNGDTFKDKVITLPFDITDCSFLMQFRKSEIAVNDNPVAFEWSTNDNTFEITDAENGVLLMKKRIIDSDVGMYDSDFQITYPNGDIETLFKAKLLINQDISRV